MVILLMESSASLASTDNSSMGGERSGSLDIVETCVLEVLGYREFGLLGSP